MKIFYFFGDSVTLGVNDAPAGGWPARFAARAEMSGAAQPPDTFYNLGVRKNSSRDIMSRWEREYLDRAIDGTLPRFMFCFGTVDTASPNGVPNIPEEESVSNMRAILLKASSYGPAVMVSAPPVGNPEHDLRLQALCRCCSEACAQAGIPFVDIHTPLSATAYADDLSDGVHPGPAGNAMIAEALACSPLIRGWW